MKKLLLLIPLLLLLVVPPDQVAQAQTATNSVIDLNWINPSGRDSTYRTLSISTNDTTATYAISDSSSQGGGMYLVLYTSDGDTIQALAKAQWLIHNTHTNQYLPFKTLTTLDSLTYGYHTGATTKNPIAEPMHFRKPKGATHVRFIVTVGTSVKQFNTAGTARGLSKLDGKIILPRF
jgi:hypothetical protein